MIHNPNLLEASEYFLHRGLYLLSRLRINSDHRSSLPQTVCCRYSLEIVGNFGLSLAGEQ